jgi:hypothetical protein
MVDKANSVPTRRIVVYEAFRDGKPLGIDLDPRVLTKRFKLRPRSSRSIVKEGSQAVGLAFGEVIDWDACGGSGGRKIHWICPRCGKKQWGDWSSDVTNPCLWYSDCNCVDKWLITWNDDALDWHS